MQTTNVIFLLESGNGSDDLTPFAYFPNDRHNHHEKGVFTSYAHIGQHSACHVDYAKECAEATPEQYNDLKMELEGIGYKLNILSKEGIL